MITTPTKEESIVWGYVRDLNGKLAPVFYTEGDHVELEGGRSGGFGRKHIQARKHDDEIIKSSKYDTADRAIFDMLWRWNKQGHTDGNGLSAYADVGGDIRLEWTSDLPRKADVTTNISVC